MSDENAVNLDESKDQIDYKALADSLVQKNGSVDGAMRDLINQTHKLRRKNAELLGRVPKDGALVLESDDAKAWAKYRELGDPKSVRDAIDERNTFKAEVSTFRKEKQIAEVAGFHGFNAKALSVLAKDLEIVEVREEKGKDGKSARVAIVKDEAGQPISLDEYAAKHWQDFMPSLKPSDTKATEPPKRPTLTERTSVPRQSVDDGKFVVPKLAGI